MCELMTVSAKEKIEGYKVVAKKLKGKRYFSIAMGFKYPLDGHIPIVRKQRRICGDFSDNIISSLSMAYRKNMIGRTSIFLDVDEILTKDNTITRWKRGGILNGYKLAIVRVVVSGDIMEGYYGSCKVAAGRSIHFMEEVTKFNHLLHD